MPEHYTEQTQRIIQDLVEALEDTAVEGAFLEDVRRMAADGTLADRRRVQVAVAGLERRLWEPGR